MEIPPYKVSVKISEAYLYNDYNISIYEFQTFIGGFMCVFYRNRPDRCENSFRNIYITVFID